MTEAAEVGGRTATKENADPVANQGITSPKIEPHEEKELPVTVALMVRPLVGGELVDGCRECVTVHANEPSISLVCKEHKFTYDHVYHGSGPSEKALYAQCVEPLVRGLLGGYNATVLAYGQTGSGKTFTMGTAGDASRDFASESEREPLGVIPRVMRTLFERVASLPGDTSVQIKVGFIEIHKEEIRDLLRPKSAVSLRDAPDGGGVTLVGAREKEVRTIEEMAKTLRDGSSARATAATGMNDRSSRSHAVFTIHVETASAGAESPSGATRAKMHLVDLAGSERAKRTLSLIHI